MQDLKKIENLFFEELATLFNTLDRIEKSIDFLDRCLDGQVNFLLDRDNATIRIVLHHYILNSIYNLFDNGNVDVISFFRITKRFKKNFRHDLFSEYLCSMKKFHSEYKSDLERIGKNRNLWTGHLGSYQNERLGFDPEEVKNVRWYDPENFIAKKDSLIFITPENILDVGLVQNINKTQKFLTKLQFDFLGVKLPS